MGYFTNTQPREAAKDALREKLEGKSIAQKLNIISDEVSGVDGSTDEGYAYRYYLTRYHNLLLRFKYEQQHGLKLFYWPEVIALRDWAAGQCFALAPTKQEAVDLVCTKYKEWSGHSEELRDELMATVPVIHVSPAGFFIYGSS